jgi:hypothetical protein
MIQDDRKTLRKAYATLLQNNLVGSGLPVQAVYSYQVGDFGGKSPVVIVSSGGALRQRLTFTGSQPIFWLNVHVFILYATEDKSWTEEMAEDALDTIENALASINDLNQHGACWDAVTQEERSRTDSIVIGGLEYRVEVFPIGFA